MEKIESLKRLGEYRVWGGGEIDRESFKKSGGYGGGG